LNTVTADDIKYQGVEINSTVMKRRGKIVQQWDMEGLDKYDANGVFEDTMKGKFTQLNKEEENAKAEKQAYEVIETNLQPKAKKVAK
jgi:hypothetical protein